MGMAQLSLPAARLEPAPVPLAAPLALLIRARVAPLALVVTPVLVSALAVVSLDLVCSAALAQVVHVSAATPAAQALLWCRHGTVVAQRTAGVMEACEPVRRLRVPSARWWHVTRKHVAMRLRARRAPSPPQLSRGGASGPERGVAVTLAAAVATPGRRRACACGSSCRAVLPGGE